MRPMFLMLLAAVPLGAAAVDDATLQRCRQVADATQRLACYDAIVLPKAVQAAGSSAGPATTAAAQTASFGLESQPAPSTAPEPLPAIDSAIEGKFEGWLPRGVLKLANGQVWEIADGSSAAYRLMSPKVRVARGVSGSFFMAIEGVSQTPRVRRLQ